MPQRCQVKACEHARELKGWRVTGLVLILLSAQAVSAETHEVTLLDQQPFTIPGPTMIIASGDTVTWINPPREDGGMHTVTQNGCFTADACEFDSEILLPGDEFSYTFSDPGVYRFRCRQHFGMKGTVIVESEKDKKTRLRQERKERKKRKGN